MLLLPHAVPAEDAPGGAEAEGGVMGTLRDAWSAHGLEERRRQSLTVTAEMAEDVFFENKLPQHEELLKALAAGPCLVVLLHKEATVRSTA